MDAASILVLVLTAGVAALLVWFEMNSRRNSRQSELKSRTASREAEKTSAASPNQGPAVSERKKAA